MPMVEQSGVTMRSVVVRSFFLYCAFVLLARSMFSADSSAAMIYVNGLAAVNNVRVPRGVQAIFRGDVIETASNSAAKVDMVGSTIAVRAESLVRYQDAVLYVLHGSVTVSTSKRTATISGDVRVSPVSNKWTEFDVTITNGIVKIVARQGGLTIDDGSRVVTLAQSQEATRDENSVANSVNKKRGSQKRHEGASPAGAGPTLSSRVAIDLGAAANAGLTTWVLLKDVNPASPSKP